MRLVLAVLALGLAVAPAHARPRHSDSAVAQHCLYTNAGRVICRAAEKRTSSHRSVIVRQRRHSGHFGHSRTVRLIPHPRGCPRRLFCACGLARYWGIWKPALNLVANWARAFRRVSGPDIGIAAIRRDRHHIMGIVGGGPGRWKTVDFNSGGHLSRVRIVSNFSGYFFVDPRERRVSR